MPFIIVRNDIASMEVDAIVNSGSTHSFIEGGAEDALYKRGGYKLFAARKAIGELQVGEVKQTDAFDLNAKYVFHTVGPIYNPIVDQSSLLYKTYSNTLKYALKHNVESIAFPLISSGLFGYPHKESFLIARKAILDFLQDYDMAIYLVVYDEESFQVSKRYYQDIKDYLGQDTYQVHGMERMTMMKAMSESLEEVLDDLDYTFQESLFHIIKEKELKEVQVYKRANMDKKLFSKIRHNRQYSPSKMTAISLCIALELNLDETEDLLAKAGYALSPGIVFDKIIAYFIENEIYDIFEINDVLFDYKQKLFGY